MSGIVWIGVVAALSGCLVDGWRCDPETEVVDLDRVVTWGQVDEADLDCEELCERIYQEESGWLAYEVETCHLEIADGHGVDPAEEVGTVTCTVYGTEGYCL